MSPRNRRSVRSLLNDELHRFVSVAGPVVTNEAIRLVTTLAATVRKALHVLVLAGFVYLTTSAFQIPEEDTVEEWIVKASTIVIGLALVYDLTRTYFSR